MSDGAICLNKSVDIPSDPQLFFFGRLFIVLLIVSSSISKNNFLFVLCILEIVSVVFLA